MLFTALEPVVEETVVLGTVNAGIGMGGEPMGAHDDVDPVVVLLVRSNIPLATAAIITITAMTTAVTVEIENLSRLW